MLIYVFFDYKRISYNFWGHFLEFDESFLGYGRYTFERFEFENGEHLDDADVEYFISGTPKYDDDGNIVNAIVFFPLIYGNLLFD